jgi:glycosyltransferase involved in cell wall biosynthesis
MRIVYCISTLAIGGAEKQALLIAEQMRSRGHIVLVLVLFHSAGVELETKLPTLRLNQPRSLSGFVRGARLARSFLGAFGADIVHSHTYPANLFLSLLRISGASGRVLNTFHNVVEGGRFRRWLARWTQRSMTAATAVSEAVRVRVIEQHLVAANSIRVIPNGIQMEDYQPEPKQRRAKRRELGAEGRFVWIAVGRVARAKDYPNLLRAFSRVREQEQNCQLWIVGGVGQDRFEAENLRVAEQIKEAVGVCWLGAQADVPSLLDAADGFVLASAWEGAPLVIAEAMAMRIPVVATDVGGVVEILSECGELAPARDSTALADAMQRVMHSSRQEIVSQTRAGRERVESCFAMKEIALQWETLYREMMEREA